MSDGPDRPYFKYSILQLEDTFVQGKTDSHTLHTLAHELDFRTTERAAKLMDRVREALSLNAQGQSKDQNAAITTATNGRIAFLPQSQPDAIVQAPPVQGQTPTQADPTTLPRIDLGDLPTFPIPQHHDEPMAILATWTALEALAPQTYRRPEDLTSGDRRCVADLSKGRPPWEAGESSRPKCILYYQIILGAIPMDQATADLVKAFGEDEERSPRAREKAAIAAVLVDKNGLLVEANAIAVSSFAWALPLALKLELGAVGAWPKIEQKIIKKLEELLRRVDDSGEPVPLVLRP